MNKPVAWVDENVLLMAKPDDFTFTANADKPTDDGRTTWIPLYTHPVKEQDCYGDGNVYRGVRSKDSEVQTIYFNPVKELTDEEIMDELVKVKHTWVATTSVWFEFEKEELKKAIRAILRKAQEK